jgi:hypothetical protein
MSKSRALRHEECTLIKALLENQDIGDFSAEALDRARVVDMKDGGMGSIRFEPSRPAQYGRTLAEAQYTDVDGVLVSIALNANKEGRFFELDIWKVDFSPLKRFPNPNDLVFRKFES